MKLDNFLSSFIESKRDNTYLKQYEKKGLSMLENLPELRSLIVQLEGVIFDNGILKIHNPGSFYFWTELTFEYFKKFNGNSYCFAFDWVGRQYAVNYSNDKTLILMLDPAKAESFELELDIESFLNEDLDEFKNDVLEFEKFNLLRAELFEPISFEKCLGFKKPLFLGGKDEPDNFEIIDMEVYWELNYQIYSKIKNLPAGTLITNISIE